MDKVGGFLASTFSTFGRQEPQQQSPERQQHPQPTSGRTSPHAQPLPQQDLLHLLQQHQQQQQQQQQPQQPFTQPQQPQQPQQPDFGHALLQQQQTFFHDAQLPNAVSRAPGGYVGGPGALQYQQQQQQQLTMLTGQQGQFGQGMPLTNESVAGLSRGRPRSGSQASQGSRGSQAEMRRRDSVQSASSHGSKGSKGSKGSRGSRGSSSGGSSNERRRQQQQQPQLPADVTQVPPCKHNEWMCSDRRAHFCTLKCLACETRWKTVLKDFSKCPDFHAEKRFCPRGAECPHPHVYARSRKHEAPSMRKRAEEEAKRKAEQEGQGALENTHAPLSMIQTDPTSCASPTGDLQAELTSRAQTLPSQQPGWRDDAAGGGAAASPFRGAPTSTFAASRNEAPPLLEGDDTTEDAPLSRSSTAPHSLSRENSFADVPPKKTSTLRSLKSENDEEGQAEQLPDTEEGREAVRERRDLEEFGAALLSEGMVEEHED